MAQKCVHKGCGKLFDPDASDQEPCVYHPGPPEFHEGQKGWKCCKPRVLTFDEFLAIPPCTTGAHSAVDDTPAPAPPQNAAPTLQPESATATATSTTETYRTPAPRIATVPQKPTEEAAAAAEPESESDGPDAQPVKGATCRRRGCGAVYEGGERSGEKCVYHPGQALFHEGTKGWSCCRKRVLEFEAFMAMPGCKTRERHCFVGRKKEEGAVEVLEDVRSDFYQTGAAVMASLYLKKIDKETSRVEFTGERSIELDLRTSDGKRYATTMPLYGAVDPAACKFRVLGTKLELTLAKKDGVGWPVLRADDKLTGEIIQTGRAGTA